MSSRDFMKFRDLSINDRFIFARELTVPGAAARGPWRKQGPRTYVHETKPHETITVGSTRDLVERLPARSLLDYLADYCALLAEQAWTAYMQQLDGALHLYGVRDGDVFTLLHLSRTPPACMHPVILENVPRHLTQTALTDWFRDKLRSKPVLPAIRLHYRL